MDRHAEGIFDPAAARRISPYRLVTARQFHLCSVGLGGHHRIRPGERYERATFHDDQHGTFATSHRCIPCASGARRVEEATS